MIRELGARHPFLMRSLAGLFTLLTLTGSFLGTGQLITRWKTKGKPASRVTHVQLTPGSNLHLADELNISTEFVVIVTSENCLPCAMSGRFHTELSRRAEVRHLPLVIILPEFSKMKNVPGLHGEIHKVNLGSVGIVQAPTVMIISGNGKIIDMWVGRMTPYEEEVALSRISGEYVKKSSYLKGDISEAAWERLKGGYEGTLLDIRTRKQFAEDHRANAINIPTDELQMRPRHEIDQSKPMIIDYSEITESMCRLAADVLSIQGFDAVALLDPGIADSHCRVPGGKSK
jgi:rhodanese-related sulfurtransferase